jgi:hypothetical protein
MRPLNPLPRSHWDRQIHFLGLIETVESASEVSLKPQSGSPGLIETAEANNFKQLSWIYQTFWRSFVLKTTCLCLNNVVEIFLRILRSHWYRRSCFRSLIETAESASVVSLKPRKRLPWAHWDRWSRQFHMIIMKFSAISKPYLKWL